MATEEKIGFLDKIGLKKLVMILGIIVTCSVVFFVAVATVYLWYNTSSHYIKVATYTANKMWDKFVEAYDDKMGNMNGRDVVLRQKDAKRAFDVDFRKDYGLSILSKDEVKPVVVITNVVEVQRPYKKYVEPTQTPDPAPIQKQETKITPKVESMNISTNVDRVALENGFKELNPIFFMDKKYMHRISSAFGVREAPQNLNTGGSGSIWHTGVDYQADIGTPIYADVEGRVSSQTSDDGYGNFIILEHKNGYYSRFAHLSKASVAYNSKVVAGQLLGYTGNGGHSNGPHCHYEIFRIVDGITYYVNPMNIYYN